MIKCSGCGANLQFSNKDEIGYAKENATLCERCFRIKNYNQYKLLDLSNKNFIPILKEISKTNALVILVVDLFQIPEHFDDFEKIIKNDVILILTKRDLLPLSISEDKLINIKNSINLNILDTIVVSSKNNYHFDDLMKSIYKHKKSEKVYVVGFTNAGKSTLINKIIYNYFDRMTEITTSNMQSTTLNTIEIKLTDDLTIVDTPGILEDGNVVNFISTNQLKKLIPKKEIKPITYQIKKLQYIIVDSYFIVETSSNNMTFYLSNLVKITRKYKFEKKEFYEKINLSVDEKQDIVINGIGFIHCSKKEKVVLYTMIKGLKIFTRKSIF